MPEASQFLSFYPDELLRKHWVNWSERYLTADPSTLTLPPNDFQGLVGSEGSTVRSRATELYRLGLLRSRLVQSRAGGRAIAPGWTDLNNDMEVHSQMGYVAYAIAKGLSLNIHSKILSQSFNTVCWFLILLIGFEHNDRWYTTTYIFRFVLREAEKKTGRVLSANERKFLAAAVFNTLDNELKSQLIEAYSNNTNTFELCFKRYDNKKITSFKLDDFQTLYESNTISIGSLERQKSSLYWGDEGRGIYSRAIQTPGFSIFDSLETDDRSRIKNRDENLLAPIYNSLHKNGHNTTDYLSFILDFISKLTQLEKEKNKLMKSLQDGVIESLQYITSTSRINQPQTFYLHDSVELDEEWGFLDLSIPKSGIPITPEPRSRLILGKGKSAKILEISEDGDNFLLKLELE